jgi:aerotaxis receptor
MLKPIPTNIEIKFEGGNMITETDLHGRITYINRLFLQMTGYTKDELIGQPHSIIRHPDMPKGCFDSMWKSIQRGYSWDGYVKNLRKDGAYYWVIVTVTPKYADDGKLCGFIAVRKPPGKLTLEQIKAKYEEMLNSELCQADDREKAS